MDIGVNDRDEAVDAKHFDHEDRARGKALILLLLVYILKPQF